MSSWLRLSIIMVLALATAALALIAFSVNQPKPVVVQAAPAPEAPKVGYLVAARPLSGGAFVRDEDFEARAAPPGDMPAGALRDTPDAKAKLRGSLVRNFIDAGHPITSQDILRPRDRGFLASVLAPGSRAVSINVDIESGVSGLIWPGDHVDVLMTQTNDKEGLDRHSASGIVLHNVRIVAIDQEIAQGAPGPNAAAGKMVRSVTLQLWPEEIKKVTLAKNLGKLSLAVRSAEEAGESPDSGAMLSPALVKENAENALNKASACKVTTVVIHAKGKNTEHKVVRQDNMAESGCGAAPELFRQSADLTGADRGKAKE